MAQESVGPIAWAANAAESDISTPPSTITVVSASELKAALTQAKGGEIIRLESGDYGTLAISEKFDAPVTLVSADTDNPAVLTGLSLRGAENLTLDGIVFDYRYQAGDPELWHSPFNIDQSTGIAIKNAVFDGDNASGTGTVADGYGAGIGLNVSNSAQITVENSSFETFYRGSVFSYCDDITYKNNEITEIRSDGLNLSAVAGALVEGNNFHDFRTAPGSLDHQDMIQVHTASTTRPTSDLTIRANILDMGSGSYTQSIWMNNEIIGSGEAGMEMAYQNILIEENFIRNGHVHGIAIGVSDGLTIRNNTLVKADGTIHSNPAVVVSAGSENVSVTDNVTGAVVIKSDDTVSSGNIVWQDKTSGGENYFEEIFLNPRAGEATKPGDFILLSGSGQAGATWLGSEDPALFRLGEASLLGNEIRLNATYSDLAETPGAIFLWNFGDGTTAEGTDVIHRYTDTGRYVITLTVTAPDGSMTQSQSWVSIEDGAVLSFEDSIGQMVSHKGDSIKALDPDLPLVSLDDGRQGIRLGNAKEDYVLLDKTATADLAHAEGFSFAAQVRLPQGTQNAGYIASLHGVFEVVINNRGDLVATVTPKDGSPVKLIAQGVRLQDGFWHDIGVSWDGNSGTFAITVDGETRAAQSDLFGELSAPGSWGLTLGSPWHDNFSGEISELSISRPMAAFDFTPKATEILQKPPALTENENESDAVTSPDPDAGTEIEGQLDDIHFHDLLQTNNHDRADIDSVTGHMNLGRLPDIEASQTLTIKVDFERDMAAQDRGMMLWNHGRLGFEIVNDRLKVYVGEQDPRKMHGLFSDRLDLDQTDAHQLLISVDAEADILKVMLDGDMVIFRTDLDLRLSDVTREFDWVVGDQWKDRQLDITMHDIEIADYAFGGMESIVADGLDQIVAADLAASSGDAFLF